jgi:hypothetical protein
MIVASVAMQTIALKRALDCPQHEWVKLNDAEDQCKHCGIIATEEGKAHLARVRARETRS